jgi:lysophospholipase L1-like esterase
MKRWWWILASIALFFIGDRLGAALLGSLLDRSPQRFSRLYTGQLHGEIACLGNSRGVVDFHAPSIAEAAGRSTVNLSHNGMTPKVARAIFADFLDHNPKPKLLVLEVSFVTGQTSKGSVLEYMPFFGHSKRLVELARQYSREAVIAGEISHLYRFNSELTLRSLIYLVRGQSDQGATMNASLSPELIEETKQLEPFPLEIFPQELEALVAIVDAAHNAGVEVRLVFAPYLPIYAEKMTNLDEVIAQISAATSRKVFDFSRSVTDTNLFADRVHLSPAGAQEFLQQMLKAGVFALTDPGITPPPASTAAE